MPLVTLQVMAGEFSAEQKRAAIERLTEALVSLEGEATRGLVWVLVTEVPDGGWGIGGRLLDASDLRALQAARSAP